MIGFSTDPRGKTVESGAGKDAAARRCKSLCAAVGFERREDFLRRASAGAYDVLRRRCLLGANELRE